MQANCTNCGRTDDLLESDGGLCARCADNRDYADAQSYRRIARILGIDPVEREKVEDAVAEMSRNNSRWDDAGDMGDLAALLNDPHTDTLLRIQTEGDRFFEVDASQITVKQ